MSAEKREEFVRSDSFIYTVDIPWKIALRLKCIGIGYRYLGRSGSLVVAHPDDIGKIVNLMCGFHVPDVRKLVNGNSSGDPYNVRLTRDNAKLLYRIMLTDRLSPPGDLEVEKEEQALHDFGEILRFSRDLIAIIMGQVKGERIDE